jgi:molybdate transport system substrate-binding protein
MRRRGVVPGSPSAARLSGRGFARSLVLLAAVAALVISTTGTSFAASPQPTSRATTKFNVFAAASLLYAFPAMVPVFKSTHKAFKNVKFVFNFQGTDTLVAQIQQGAPADVFAGASTKYGDQLLKAGLVNPYSKFCQNKLIVILPKSNPGNIKSLADLATSGKKIAIGNPNVPIGTYTLTVLKNLNALYGASYSTNVQANVVTQEANVTAVVTDVLLGEADAGFCYVTDAQYAGKKIKRVYIGDRFQSNPLPTYPIATVKASSNASLAAQFVYFVLHARGQAIMKKWGFLPPPAPAK